MISIKLRAAAIVGALGLACAFPAAAAIGTPSAVGSMYTTTDSASNQTTMSADSPIGSFIVDFTASTSNVSITCVVDNANGGAGTCGTGSGNCSGAYTADNSAFLTIRLADYLCDNTAFDLPSGHTLTTTFSGSTGRMAQAAFTITGLKTSGAVDTGAHTTLNGSGTSVSGFSVTPSQAGSTILTACVWITSGNTADNYVEDTADGWTATAGGPYGSNTNLLIHCAYKIVSSTASVTWAPTWTNTRTWNALSSGFEAASGGAPKICTLATMGAGPC